MRFPTITEIEAVHRQQAKTEAAYALVFTHCTIVAEIAAQIISSKKLAVDKQLVHAGALLHDIGAYKFIDTNNVFNKTDYIRHGIEGARILQHAGFDEAFVRIAERHTGVGLVKEEITRRNLPLPADKDYIAETVEERLVMYADKFHSKTPCFHTFDWYCRYVSQWGEKNREKFKALADEFGIPDLSLLIEKYHMRLTK